MSIRLFTSESVTEGHPDKVCDKISDSILDAILREDSKARVACETCCTTDLVMVMGEITTNATVNFEKIVRDTVKDIGYSKPEYGFDADTCKIIIAIDSQSPDIAMGVDNALENKEGGEGNGAGAGDQGMMFGYACNETDSLMPLSIDLAHKLTKKLTSVRKNGVLPYLRPDGKSQVTVAYDEKTGAISVDTVVISTQHDPDVSQADLRKGVIDKIIKPVLGEYYNDDIKIFVNPTGSFVIGGPHGDSGLTGRKIIVDTYGGRGAHGGGAFSGKDPSKVDRSAAYAARWIAKNMVAAGVAKEMLVQISYAIGVAQPVSVCVNTYGTAKVALSDGEIAKKVSEMFDLRPQGIIEALKLKQPMYEETARYGHMGRTNEVVKKTFVDNGQVIEREVELFTWEKLDRVADIKQAFGL